MYNELLNEFNPPIVIRDLHMKKEFQHWQQHIFKVILITVTAIIISGCERTDYNSGIKYHHGKGVVQDYAEAVKWYKLAADKGHKGAQYNLGVMYYKGEGVVQDYVEAVKWYKLAAEQGESSAQYNLGHIYDFGNNVIGQDYAEAIRWYKLASEQEHASAQHSLGVKYVKGQGVIKNYMTAHMWWNIAASNGMAMGKKHRDQIEKDMTSDDIKKAQNMARECVKKKYKDC